MLEWRNELLNICSHVNADLQWSLNLRIPIAEVKQTNNREKKKSPDSWDANSQTTTTLCGKLSSFCLLVVKMKPQIFRLHHFSSPICSPLMFTPNLSFHLGIFGPCFQPVFRQWKEESERFWFYLSSMGWLCCFFDVGKFFNIYGIS